ncbi:MAG: hypothetical protein JXA37_13440 [Chloroflexia bacterium]|nr:hypothetical protein [Chloroflexia bacterium]
MEGESLAPEILERVHQKLLREHPELAGGELRVRPRLPSPQEAAAAAKLGLPQPKQQAPTFVVTLRKCVPTEDGVMLPLSARVTVDAQGRVVKRRQRR